MATKGMFSTTDLIAVITGPNMGGKSTFLRQTALIVVMAQTPPKVVKGKEKKQITAFIVEKGMAGFAAQEIKHKMSLRASVTSALFFDNVRVPEANRLPNVKGLKGPLGCLNQARYGITWGPIGAAISSYTCALEYSKSRILFNRPIAATQAVQLKLADMARRITLAQLLKVAGILGTGGEAKYYLMETPVLVNGEPEQRRGKQSKTPGVLSGLIRTLDERDSRAARHCHLPAEQ